MSGKTKGAKGTQSKAEKSNDTEELKNAKAKIVSLEGKVKKLRDLEKNEKNLQDEVKRLTVRVLSLEHDFNYEEVRRRLPESMDSDAIFATENARLVNEVKRLEEELEKSKGSTRKMKDAEETIDVLRTNKAIGMNLRDLETRLELLRIEKTHSEIENSHLKEKIKQLEDNIDNLEKKSTRTSMQSIVKELEKENEALKKRLSQLACAQLLTNDPNIADLSDSNRPTKLAEIYSELYDNEWANAYEGLESKRKSETEIITKLREKMLGIYHHCSILAKQHGETLNAIVMGAEGKTIKDDDIPPAKLRQLKDVRRVFAPEMAETVCKKFMENGPKDTDVMNAYVIKCVKLCWFICVHDPPLVIDTRSHDGAFNGAIFKTYTKGGKTLDYVVWPPLYLHEGGPILCQGVAQGK